MGERFNLKSIWKSNDPEKLKVFRASSLENEIRFYFNDEQYVVARDKDGTFSIEYEETQKLENDEQDNESILTYIKKNIKDEEFKKILTFVRVISILIVTFEYVSTIALVVLIDNTIISIFLMNLMWLFMRVFFVVIFVCKFIPQSIKSKHSAEHMMANFLEKNKRLPKNMKEIKETSRFCVGCGSRKIIQNLVEIFVQNILAVIITIFIDIFAFQNFQNELIYSMIVIVTYLIISCNVWILIYKYNKLSFIMKPIEDRLGDMLNNIVQCSNTTKKVKDSDLQLAYYAAKHWLQIVYPEFYSEDDNDIFNESEKS